MLRLLGALPDRVRGSRTGGRSRIRPAEFVPGKFEKSLVIDSLPVWIRSALNVERNGLICLTHRVRAEVGNAPLYDLRVFFWSSQLATIGREFGKSRAGDDYRKAAVRVEDRLALRIGTIKIGLLAVLLNRDGNERPCSHEVLGRRLRDRLLYGQKNTENQR